MAESFRKIGLQLDVTVLRDRLIALPEVFGWHKERGIDTKSPHREGTDIWVRYNDITPFYEGRSMTEFGDEHDSIWYPVLKLIPEVADLVFDVMTHMSGERLGGVLITKLSPGGKIHPHIDNNWHANYYDKFYVPLLNNKGATFCFEDGCIEPEEGEVYQFNNSYKHWVNNDSDTDRIAMIVCVKTNHTIL